MLRCVLEEYGAQYLMIRGTFVMPEWCADNWATLIAVSATDTLTASSYGIRLVKTKIFTE